MYVLTKYIKSVLWGVAIRLSYIYDAWCLKVKQHFTVDWEERKERPSEVCSFTIDIVNVNITPKTCEIWQPDRDYMCILR